MKFSIIKNAIADFFRTLKEKELENYWNDKYKTGRITYRGRSLPFSKKVCTIPVNILITPHDPYIKSDLKNWGFFDDDEDWETKIPKIYKKIREEYYKYRYDRLVWGADEVWEFPFEMRAKGFSKGFDCDSYSHFQASYYIAAGFPRWRVRVVCGNTQLGGHSTIYIYSMKDGEWHHLNSTYGRDYNEISKFPTHKDAEEGNDRIGINNVWFSFNDLNCWYDFKGDIPDELELEV